MAAPRLSWRAIPIWTPCTSTISSAHPGWRPSGLSQACAATDMTSQSMFIPRGGETTG